MKSELLTLLQKTQPHAVGMNGGGIMPSPVRWAGTEGDMTPAPEGFNSTTGIWSTYCCNNKVQPTTAPWSLQHPLLTPTLNPGSLYRRAKST